MNPSSNNESEVMYYYTNKDFMITWIRNYVTIIHIDSNTSGVFPLNNAPTFIDQVRKGSYEVLIFYGQVRLIMNDPKIVFTLGSPMQTAFNYTSNHADGGIYASVDLGVVREIHCEDKICKIDYRGAYELGWHTAKVSCCGVTIPINIRNRIDSDPPSRMVERCNPGDYVIGLSGNTLTLHRPECIFRQFLKITERDTCHKCGQRFETETELENHMKTNELKHLKIRIKELEKKMNTVQSKVDMF